MSDLAGLLVGLAVAGVLALASGPSEDPQTDSPIRIDTVREGDHLHLHGVALADRLPIGDARYELEVTKQGPSGASTSRQSGTFRPAPGSADTLSTVRLGVQPGDTVVARLTVVDAAGSAIEADYRGVIR